LKEALESSSFKKLPVGDGDRRKKDIGPCILAIIVEDEGSTIYVTIANILIRKKHIYQAE